MRAHKGRDSAIAIYALAPPPIFAPGWSTLDGHFARTTGYTVGDLQNVTLISDPPALEPLVLWSKAVQHYVRRSYVWRVLLR